MSNTVTVKGIEAINFTGMSNVKSFTPSADGVYAITLKSNVTLNYGKLPVNQVFLFNTTHPSNNSGDDWYLDISTQQGATVHCTAGKPIYVFLVDHMNVGDNTGQADVTFTKVG